MVAVRIALLSPYSWTYPGGVTRHIEALAAELTALATTPASSRRSTPTTRSRAGCTAAPARSASIHPTGFVVARAHRRLPRQRRRLEPRADPAQAVLAMRRELRNGGYDVRAHPRAGRAAARLGRALLDRAELPLVGTFHTYSENALTNGIAQRCSARGGG